MSDLTPILVKLAEIETQQKNHTDAIKSIDGKLDTITNRLGAVETKAAQFGSIAGAVVSVGTSLIIAKLKGIGGA